MSRIVAVELLQDLHGQGPATACLLDPGTDGAFVRGEHVAVFPWAIEGFKVLAGTHCWAQRLDDKWIALVPHEALESSQDPADALMPEYLAERLVRHSGRE